MAKHDVLLLGLGLWGTRWMQALHASKDCRLVEIAGDATDVARLAKEYDLGPVKTFDDYREAIKETKADIVIIAIPNALHVDAAKRALERGLNVLSEKPLGTNIQEAREALAYKKKFPSLKYMVSQNYRWRPHNQTLKKAIADGLIGRMGSIHFEFRRPEDVLGYREFLELPLLQDVSIHHFDLMRLFAGAECEQIYAHAFRPSWSKFQGKSATEAVLLMAGGITINYNATWAARGKPTSWDGDITITGDQGCVMLDAADQVRYFKAGGTQGVLLDKVEMERTELDYALEMFVRSIDRDEIPETTLEDNFNSFAMVCAAEESARSSRPVKVPRLEVA